MNTRHSAAVTVLFAAAVVHQASAVIINVPGDQPTIQAAIDAAMNGDEIVVAPATYFETINFNGKAITLRSSDPDDPDVVAATIIDGTGFFHVVQCVNGEGPDTVLDGFTITGGNANGTFPDNGGGGMYNSPGSSPTVINCTFSGNTANSRGGGMLNRNSSPTVTNCTFSGNSATSGGGMLNASGSPTVTNCTFSGNTAFSIGGGMYNDNSSPAVTDCTFSGNTAFAINIATRGGGMANLGGNPTVTNCTFTANSADQGGGMSNAISSPTVTNCVLWGDTPDEIGSAFSDPNVTFSDVESGFPGTGNIDADPLFIDPGNGDFRLQAASPCIDAGDNTAVPEDITTDLDGNPRFVDDPGLCDLGQSDGVNPVVDMGAFEFQMVSPLVDCNANGVADTCDIADGISLDCNANVVPDECDIDEGTSDDCNGDGVPDECNFADCNENGVLDECDITDGTSTDCNANGIPDECNFVDCNGNGVLDVCDIADGTSPDVNGNDVPDECECLADISGDGSVDITDFLQLLAVWGPCEPGCFGDVDFDGNVGIIDFLMLLSQWGPCR